MEDESPVSRRGLLKKVAGGLGLAAVASVVSAKEAEAANGDYVRAGNYAEGFGWYTRLHTVPAMQVPQNTVDPKGFVTTYSDESGTAYFDQLKGALIASSTMAGVPGVNGYSRQDSGVFGSSFSGTGVRGTVTNGTGVWGTGSPNGNGVWGDSTGGTGVRGASTSGTAVWGESTNGTGVWGASTNGTAIAGESAKGDAISVISRAPANGSAGVRSRADEGVGVMGISRDYSGMYGKSVLDAGVYGYSSHGWGLVGGIATNTGRSQLWLQPGTSPTPPSGPHKAGEIYLGSTGTLHQCVAQGDPGTWLRVGFNPVNPVRICDTRDGQASAVNTYAGRHLAAAGANGDTLTVTVSGPIGSPSAVIVPPEASSVMLNVTVTNITAAGFLTVYPAGAPRPLASNLNFAAPGAVPVPAVPNLVCVKLGPIPSSSQTGINIYNGSPGTLDVIVDVAGFFS